MPRTPDHRTDQRNLVDPPLHSDLADADQLRVGGLIPLTTIDYPGELAAVVFCQGCTWRCRYCQNGALIDPTVDPAISWPEVREFLERRQGLLDAVVFSGGEPTLQSALPAAMREARQLGFKIGLHTAGSAPQRLVRLLHLLDWVALDIKAFPADYPAITGVEGSGEVAWASLDLIRASGISLEVRTTIMPDWAPESLASLAAALAQAGVTHYAVQACDHRHALDPLLPPQKVPFAQLVAAIDTTSFSQLIVRGL